MARRRSSSHRPSDTRQFHRDRISAVSASRGNLRANPWKAFTICFRIRNSPAPERENGTVPKKSTIAPAGTGGCGVLLSQSLSGVRQPTAGEGFVETRMNVRCDLRNRWNYYLIERTFRVFRRCQNAAKIVLISRFGTLEYQVELLVFRDRAIATRATRGAWSSIRSALLPSLRIFASI